MEKDLYRPPLYFLSYVPEVFDGSLLKVSHPTEQRQFTKQITNKHTVKSEASLVSFLTSFSFLYPLVGDKRVFRICAIVQYNIAYLGPGFTYLISFI